MAGKETRTLEELAAQIGGQAFGQPLLAIARPAPADSDDPAAICFAGNRKYLEIAERSGVGAVVLAQDLLPCTKPHIVVPDAREAFGRLLELFRNPLPLAAGVHEWAVVDPTAEIHPEASVGPFVVVEGGARIAARSMVYPFAYIGEGCSLGEGATVYPHAVLYQNVEVGAGSIIHAGAVIGADGFGFEWNGDRQVKVPQVGSVSIGSEVEVGANTAIDRAMSGTTEIGDGVKIDNLVQVGHNVRIGKHTVIAAQTGLSGSTEVGERVTMGGATATSHHVSIADGSVLGGRTGVTSDIEETGEYWGTPARPMREAMKAALLAYRLPEIMIRLRELEKKVSELENK